MLRSDGIDYNPRIYYTCNAKTIDIVMSLGIKKEQLTLSVIEVIESLAMTKAYNYGDYFIGTAIELLWNAGDKRKGQNRDFLEDLIKAQSLINYYRILKMQKHIDYYWFFYVGYGQDTKILTALEGLNELIRETEIKENNRVKDENISDIFVKVSPLEDIEPDNIKPAFEAWD